MFKISFEDWAKVKEPKVEIRKYRKALFIGSNTT
jgi:hypothetical protein